MDKLLNILTKLLIVYASHASEYVLKYVQNIFQKNEKISFQFHELF